MEPEIPPQPPPEPSPDAPAEGAGRARKPFLLRISPQLMEDLRAWAAHDMRSLNGQIEYLLRDAVKRRRGKKE